MDGLAFIELGADLLVRLDTIISVEEVVYGDDTAHTRIHLLGKSDPLWYHGPLGDVRDLIQQALTALTAPATTAEALWPEYDR